MKTDGAFSYIFLNAYVNYLTHFFTMCLFVLNLFIFFSLILYMCMLVGALPGLGREGGEMTSGLLVN